MVKSTKVKFSHKIKFFFSKKGNRSLDRLRGRQVVRHSPYQKYGRRVTTGDPLKGRMLSWGRATVRAYGSTLRTKHRLREKMMTWPLDGGWLAKSRAVRGVRFETRKVKPY